jgi:hypothetical protein
LAICKKTQNGGDLVDVTGIDVFGFLAINPVLERSFKVLTDYLLLDFDYIQDGGTNKNGGFLPVFGKINGTNLHDCKNVVQILT